MYEQTLYKIVQPIKKNTIKRLNKSKKSKYGYNKEHDIVVISKTGEIGDIYEIQNFQIALPKVPKKIHKSIKNHKNYKKITTFEDTAENSPCDI